MIGRLTGLVAEIGEEEALIDVGGVGYVVRCGSKTLSRLPPPGARPWCTWSITGPRPPAHASMAF